MKSKVKQNSNSTTVQPVKKSVLSQVMKPKDWVLLATLIVVFVFCWLWVWQAYSQPFDYNLFVSNSIS